MLKLPTALLLGMVAAAVICANEPQTTAQSEPKATGDSRTQPASRQRPRVRFGGFSIGAGYSHYSGPAYYPYGYYPYWAGWAPYAAWYPGYWGYDPFFSGSWIHPGFLAGYGYQPAMGEIKLRSSEKDAWVYLDGALAGQADKLKNMWLEPGAYQLEVRSGQKRFSQKVYVLTGKSLRLNADLERGAVVP